MKIHHGVITECQLESPSGSPKKARHMQSVLLNKKLHDVHNWREVLCEKGGFDKELMIVADCLEGMLPALVSKFRVEAADGNPQASSCV